MIGTCTYFRALFLSFYPQYCQNAYENGLDSVFGTPTILLFYLFTHLLMSYVVASAIKDLLKKHGMMTAGDFAEAASAYLEKAVQAAGHRAKENGRVTVRPCDL